MLTLFQRLRAMREFERQQLPFLKTTEDHDLLWAIGLHQAQGEPLTVKQIFLQGFGTVPTIQRRLARLRRLGVIHHERDDKDRRSVRVLIAPRVMRAFAQYKELLERRELAEHR